MQNMNDIKKEHYDIRETLNTKTKIRIISEIFQKNVGYVPDLRNPRSFNEKIQWLKLYYQDPRITQCADKYAVKDYIAKTIGEEYAVPTIASWDDPDQIDFDNLPERYVLKVNWSSGYNIVVPDRSRLDVEKARAQIRSWMMPYHNSYYHLFNWGFRHMKPVVYAEEYLEESNDYKFHICDGRFQYLLIVMDRGSEENATFTWFDKEFNALPFSRCDRPADSPPKKPLHYEKMIELAEKLAEPFPFVRVDFYESEGRIYVGEMTFYSGSGLKRFKPVEWDYRLGEAIHLPEKLITDKEGFSILRWFKHPH